MCNFCDFILARNPAIEGRLSAIFIIIALRYDCCFVLLTQFIYMTFEWVLLEIFLWHQSEFETKGKLNFNNFLRPKIFGIVQLCLKHAQLERISLYISSLETLASNQPFIITITKLLSNKSGETFCEALEWMRKLFEIDGQKDF